MPEFLLVDGYNIINAWDDLKKMMAADLAHARAKLIDILGNYQAVRGVRVIVVFDAHLVRGGAGSRENEAGVDVIYTTEGETADMLIEKLVGQFGENDRVTVATSDWTQQRFVFGKGAVRLSARELAQEIMSVWTEAQRHLGDSRNHDRTLREHLDDRVKAILEKIRRQR